jgi:hypothetical protein
MNNYSHVHLFSDVIHAMMSQAGWVAPVARSGGRAIEYLFIPLCVAEDWKKAKRQ